MTFEERQKLALDFIESAQGEVHIRYTLTPSIYEKSKDEIDINYLKHISDSVSDIFDRVLSAIEGTGSAFIDNDIITILYNGVHANPKMEMGYDNDFSIVIFEGKNLGQNFCGDGDIVTITKILKIF